MRVRDVMTREVFTVSSRKSLLDVREILEWRHIRHVPVVDDYGRLTGIISHRDLLNAAVTSIASIPTKDQNNEYAQVLIGAVARAPAVSVGPDFSLADAAELILRGKLGCLPVVDSGKLVGIVTESDFVALAINFPDQRVVGDFMTTDLWTVDDRTSMLLVKEVMNWARIRHVPYVDSGDKLLGMISHRDLVHASLSSLLRCGSAERDNFLEAIPIVRVAKRDIEVIFQSTTIQDAAKKMLHYKTGALPVVAGEKLVGIVTEADMVRCVAERSFGVRRLARSEQPTNLFAQ